MWIFCPLCGALYTDDTTTHMDWHAWLADTISTPPAPTQPLPPTPEEP